MKNIFLLFVAILALFLIKQSFEEIDECERNGGISVRRSIGGLTCIKK
jgi:hypothetical protein